MPKSTRRIYGKAHDKVQEEQKAEIKYKKRKNYEKPRERKNCEKNHKNPKKKKCLLDLNMK